MGKQINYFMNEKDLKVFYSFIISKEDYLIERIGNIKQIKCPCVTSTEGAFWIVSSNSNLYYNNSILDPFKSEVIEYSIGKLSDYNELGEGRLWISSDFEEDGELYKKDDWFFKWFESYRRWLKKYCIKSKDSFYYIGKDAYRAYKAGEIIPTQMTGYEYPVPFE